MGLNMEPNWVLYLKRRPALDIIKDVLRLYLSSASSPGFHKHVQKLQLWTADVRKSLARSGPLLVVFYERLKDNTEVELRRILEFLK